VKILFTADWHLGYELGGTFPQKRIGDQERNLHLIAKYIEDREIDVLAIAGDVFETQDKGPARLAVRTVTRIFRPALERGLTIVAVAGNHDRDWFMETANEWLDAGVSGSPRVILRTRPDLVTIGPEGDRVNFALLPFPTPSRYDLPADDPGSLGLKNQRLAEVFLEQVEAIRKRAEKMKLPVVLLTHVTVAGTRERAHRITPSEDVLIPRGRFPGFELTVIGHIHKGEPPGAGDLLYVGALDRMDIGEADYTPQVLIAEFDQKGLKRGSLTSLELDPTPFQKVRASSIEEIEAAASAMSEPDRTLVKLELAVPLGTFTAPMINRARALFPRLYGNVDHDWQGDSEVRPAVEGLDYRDVMGTIRTYFAERVKDEAEREELLTLVEELRTRPTEEVGA
jgi:exonuclease SbcD